MRVIYKAGTDAVGSERKKTVQYDPEDFEDMSESEVNEALQEDAWNWACEHIFWSDVEIVNMDPVEKGL